MQVNSAMLNYSGLGVSSQSDSSGKTYYIRCSCGLLNSERTPDGETHYYLFDYEDSVVGLTNNQTGSEDNIYDYYPYGQIKQQKTGGETNPWTYASGYLDSSTGLYHFGARYYDSTLGRWTQQDSAGGSLSNLSSANRYIYASDDPVNMVDPSGNFSLTIGCISAIVGLGYGFITAVQGLIATAQGWLGLAAFAAALSTGPAGWIIYIVTIGVSLLITAALAVGFYEGVAAACGLPTIP